MVNFMKAGIKLKEAWSQVTQHTQDLYVASLETDTGSFERRSTVYVFGDDFFVEETDNEEAPFYVAANVYRSKVGTYVCTLQEAFDWALKMHNTPVQDWPTLFNTPKDC